MLGGGNPVGGSNPIGTGSSLNFIGNHCYAYSGMFESDTNPATMLKFTTGSFYSVAKLTVSGAIDNVTTGNGVTSVFTVKVNGEEVMRIKVDTDQEDSPTLEVVPFLIEPNSTMEVIGISNGAVSTRALSASIVGRVYA